ncbi:MAG: RusA family crossover junction endodeoxyribonuclease [Candidatus Aminicenantes bacterium]|nr:RusA family crossover junction endodeoxyribonuclease [Candidatus Aminicenantes bacterium]
MKFHIIGIPFSKQSMRHRMVNVPGKKTYIQNYKPSAVRDNEDSVRYQVLAQLPRGFTPWRGPVIIDELTYIFPLLKSFSKKKLKSIEAGDTHFKHTKPDLTDNLNKGVFDALEGVLFLNDSQICEIMNARKIYGLKPGIVLEIREMKNA